KLELLRLAQRREDLRREEVRVDHEVPRLTREEASERGQVELLDEQTQMIAERVEPTRLIEQIVKVPEDVWRPVAEVEVRLAVDAAKDGVGHRQHVAIDHMGIGMHLTQGELDRLGRSHVARTDRRRQHENTSRHVASDESE